MRVYANLLGDKEVRQGFERCQVVDGPGENRLGYGGCASGPTFYYKARFYSPLMGRFMQTDPIGMADGLNRYAYVDNSPLNFSDPLGLAKDTTGGALSSFKSGLNSLGNALDDAITGGYGQRAGRAFSSSDYLGWAGNLGAGVAYGLANVYSAAVGAVSSGVNSAARVIVNGCCCFAAGTPVLTDTGFKPIEDIRVGDLVWARDSSSGQTSLKPVTQLIHTEGKELYRLTLRAADGTLTHAEVTDNHPYWVQGQGWVDSGRLASGMLLEGFDKNASLTVVELLPLQRVEKTYNFTVADYHSYFAGASQAFVHNCSCLVNGAKDVLPAAAAKIDPVKIREIESIVRSGGTHFPLDAGAQLRAVAESFASKVRNAASPEAAAHIRDVGLGAIDRLDRFKALTPEAVQQLRNIVSGAFKP